VVLFFQAIVAGLATGAIYALVAVGYNFQLSMRRPKAA